MATKKWRKSATLILVNKESNDKGQNISDYDYNLLLLKRSDQTAVVSNQCVFPGGLFDEADESIEWLQYFEEFGVTQSDLKKLIIINQLDRPQLLASQGTGCYDRFFKQSKIWAREISLRITAIRETFEEVGVLLCRTKDQLNEKSDCCFVFNELDKIYWQQRVHDDPREFVCMCRVLNVIPDLWNLYEWSVWASPGPLRKGYETAFFISFLSETPNLLIEESEVKECMWLSSINFIKMYRNSEIWSLPPQLYENLRFTGVKSFDVLQTFAIERSTKGVALFLPIGYICNDGMVSVLPGDDLYLDDPRSCTEFFTVDSTKEELRAKAKYLHRAEDVAVPHTKLYMNIDPQYGHLSPVKPLSIKNKL